MPTHDASRTALTANARLVLELVRANGSGRHLTTNDVFAEARERRPAIGYSTVSRALRRLRAHGLVDEVVVPGSDAVFYEPKIAPHAHFRCRSCGAVADLAYVVAPRMVRSLARRYDVDVDGATLTLHGRCAACRYSA